MSLIAKIKKLFGNGDQEEEVDEEEEKVKERLEALGYL
ncbi:MAG: hypothetical protein MAG715_00252 [Methanonatronarchaeales archaeon]|nr:hypothetical protein [Methanonatronarchaeales archaeon]